MNESPNDSEYVRMFREMLLKTHTGRVSSAKHLLTCWLKATEADFTTDERHELIKQTRAWLSRTDR